MDREGNERFADMFSQYYFHNHTLEVVILAPICGLSVIF